MYYTCYEMKEQVGQKSLEKFFPLPFIYFKAYNAYNLFFFFFIKQII